MLNSTPCLRRYAQPSHYPIESALFAAVQPVRVVNLAGTVDAQADEKIVFLEEAAPLVVEKDAVRLKGMFYGLLGSAVLFDKLDGATEELELSSVSARPLATPLL